MYDFVRRSGILIPRLYQNEKFYSDIKNHLTRISKNFHTNLSTINHYYEETDKFLVVPRFLNINKFVNCNITNKTKKGKLIDITHNIIPRNNTQKKAMDFLLKHDRAILKLSPGMGKTVISIYVVSERKLKSFIIVHRDGLVKQWQNRFEEFTNLSKNEISILKSKSFKEDLKKPIIIATIQTLVSLLKRNKNEFATELKKANIGIGIFDEIHTSVGAPVFSMVSLYIPARYIIGLSATPFRKDGTNDIIKYHLGEIFENESIDDTMDCKITIILMNFEILTLKRQKYIYWSGRFIRSRYLNQMIKSTKLINLLIDLFKKFDKENRMILTVCERIKLIDKLFEITPIKNTGKFIGVAQLDIFNNNKLILATPQKCRDGLDIVNLDTLIMTSPISNIEQLTGRIIRKKNKKNQPVIVDLVDLGCKDIYNSSIQRIKFYEKREWKIQYLFINGDNKITKINKNKFLNLIT